MATDLTPVRLVGRPSSHFTRVAAIMALEAGVAFELVAVHDLTSLDPATYGGHPALKIPALPIDGALVLGTENICRTLVERAPVPVRVVWPEALTSARARSAQELVWHAMAAQVQLIMGTTVGQLPPDNVFFAKVRAGLEGALGWLEAHVPAVLAELPAGRTVSLFEITLFCLIEHLRFRPTVSVSSSPRLEAFAAAFAARPSAAQTPYRFAPPPAAPSG